MDVLLLTFFRSAPNQDDQPVAIFAEVNAVAGTKINPVLVDTGANALGVGKITLLDACQSSGHLGRCLLVQTIGPRGKRASSAPIQVFAHFDHT